MPVPAPSAPRGQRGLRLLGERTKTHIRDEQRDLQDQGLLGVGADHQLRADLDVVEQRLGGELGGQDLDVVPVRKRRARYTHRHHVTVVTRVFQPMLGQVVNPPHRRLLRGWCSRRHRPRCDGRG